MTRPSQKGAGTLKAIIWTILFVAIVYSGVKIIPVYVNNYQLQDSMKEEARFAGVERKTADQVQTEIYKKVQELEIPVKRESIRVEPDMNGYKITVNYTVTVMLLSYQLNLQFNNTANSQSI